ncbi:SUN family beta-glucosidase [Geosmithia morbida]|uniref:SUN family beta-glucosidase n=1 Tax=Geosmithia morbida TaxID=1094350 RepID=A0A9P4YUH8_9HYPO|nr:SUN family beta-glucosidase [Geosmithia morbida]KAF4123336.1 SUN family beta-glucosidase [Geosmithia morbida]
MRYSVTYTVAATLVAGAAAHQHGHQQFHARKDASPVEKRAPDAVTEYVAGPTETVYELNGEIVSGNDVKNALDNGEYVVVGETWPTFSAPAIPTTTSSSSIEIAAQFLEKSTSSSSSVSVATTSSSSSVASASASASPTSSPSTGGSGISSSFPDGKVKCSDFPSDYGAVALDWLDLGGWSGLQFVPNYSDGDVSISDIITGIAGETCSKGSMCSYACPAGYQKTQWPSAQGSTKQSIGGLYCNSDGYLELTRKEYDTLCEAGAGGVSIQNDLDEEVATCRTDYPGTESMVVPAVAAPGGTVELCNPDQENYYTWDGLATSAQYYINPKGISQEDGCVWNSPVAPDSAGNWAPLIAGVGYTSDGITYLSIFQNLPTSDAKLDFNVEITGDVSTECSYIDGQWTGGSSGCTTAMTKGGKAVFRYF